MKKLEQVEKALEEFDERKSKTSEQRMQELVDRLEIINPDNDKDFERSTRRIDVLEDMLDIMNEH